MPFVPVNKLELRTSNVLKNKLEVSHFSGNRLARLYSSSLAQGWGQVRAIHEGEHTTRAWFCEDISATLLEVAHQIGKRYGCLKASGNEQGFRLAPITLGSTEIAKSSPRC